MESHLRTATVFSYLLDNQFNLFGLRLGLNSFIDLVPGFGDAAAALLSLYLVWIALEMELPRIKIMQMLWNILVNFIIGLIPVIGDLAYIFRKANMKNLQILKDHAKSHPNEGRIIQPPQYATNR